MECFNYLPARHVRRRRQQQADAGSGPKKTSTTLERNVQTPPFSFLSHCYLLATTSVTWSKAEDLCKAHGGHLLVLNNDYISKIIPVRHNYWIGLVERQHEGQWSWVDGTDLRSTPMFWDKGQPDDWDYRENGEDCGQLHGSERRKRKLLNDAECTQSYRYICEKRFPTNAVQSEQKRHKYIIEFNQFVVSLSATCLQNLILSKVHCCPVTDAAYDNNPECRPWCELSRVLGRHQCSRNRLR
uniref:Asialoglycoprotein receptor-like 1 n=1 Tax=Amphilophus citrinellus TaxID=61819 RepID=A0A3Q0SJ22_AMPCI